MSRKAGGQLQSALGAGKHSSSELAQNVQCFVPLQVRAVPGTGSIAFLYNEEPKRSESGSKRLCWHLQECRVGLVCLATTARLCVVVILPGTIGANDEVVRATCIIGKGICESITSFGASRPSRVDTARCRTYAYPFLQGSGKNFVKLPLFTVC